MARKKKDLESMEFEGDEPDLPAMDEEVTSDEDLEVAASAEPEEPRPVAPDFPLGEGHYFFTPVLSPRGHSEGPGVAALRERLGLSASDQFDGDLMVAVQSFQKDMGDAMSGVVDAALWQEIFSR